MDKFTGKPHLIHHIHNLKFKALVAVKKQNVTIVWININIIGLIGKANSNVNLFVCDYK